MSDYPIVQTLAELAAVNPIDYAEVYVEEKGCVYVFIDYTYPYTPTDEDVSVGNFANDHPTHAGLPFMQGWWTAG